MSSNIERKYIYNAKLLRVVDADTVDVSIDLGFDIWIRERVRLRGINAPEKRTKDLNEKRRGIEAESFVLNLFDQYGTEFTLITEYTRGKYGRTIGEIIFPNGTSLNESLLQSGHAVPYPE